MSLPAMFAAQVTRTPNAAAISCDGRSMTYRELDDAANGLARQAQMDLTNAYNVAAAQPCAGSAGHDASGGSVSENLSQPWRRWRMERGTSPGDRDR